MVKLKCNVSVKTIGGYLYKYIYIYQIILLPALTLTRFIPTISIAPATNAQVIPF